MLNIPCVYACVLGDVLRADMVEVLRFPFASFQYTLSKQTQDVSEMKAQSENSAARSEVTSDDLS